MVLVKNLTSNKAAHGASLMPVRRPAQGRQYTGTMGLQVAMCVAILKRESTQIPSTCLQQRWQAQARWSLLRIAMTQ